MPPISASSASAADVALHPVVAQWFNQAFDAPSDIQKLAWPHLFKGNNVLLSAPTGSGKTLAAFLIAIDRLVRQHEAGELSDTTSVLYISPLRALAGDIQRNLQQPLNEVGELLGEALPIRVQVRTGDTPQSERAKMRRRAPHILVTTPESAYILLTSDSGRAMLKNVKTVIVDEIHALADNKRGAHLSLSLQRLQRIRDNQPLQYIGVSATQKPLDETANLLCAGAPCEILTTPSRSEMDLSIHVPDSPLSPVMANEVWGEIYRKIAEWAGEHRTTLVFVPTRRLAERASKHLAELLGEDSVATHHGSLAREQRQEAEQRLKNGELRCLVATASLELGIDIGSVELVCQIGSPRNIRTLLQRIGRSGHRLYETPKGKLLPLSPNDLAECTALLHALRAGDMDCLSPCPAALDVMAQQMVAEVACNEIAIDDLYALVRNSWPYRHIQRKVFDDVLNMLIKGYVTVSGHTRSTLHCDDITRTLRPHRSARLTALTCGGTIPDQFEYDVVLIPQGLRIGTLNEDFAFESVPGDVFQLGNCAYRLRKVEQGRVYVEDAAGMPSSLPFWITEGNGRSDEVSLAVSQLREQVSQWLAEGRKAAISKAEEVWGLTPSAAQQLINHLHNAHQVLGVIPTHQDIVVERFLDPLGDMHLIIHSTWGARINRAWGLALRKKFCRRFNFELQAAAVEDSLMLSLSAVHSFSLEEVTRYLNSNTLVDTLTQAVLDAPMFATRWRWCASIALAVKTFWNGRKAPPWFQRNDSENLLAQVFPDQIACAENLTGAREIPDHPLVVQTLEDCLQQSMDAHGMVAVQQGIESGRIRVHCRDLAAPSPLTQDILNARPYAFLDDAPAEERRALAAQTQKPATASTPKRVQPAVTEQICAAIWTPVRSPDELYDFIARHGFVTQKQCREQNCWHLAEPLLAQGRLLCVQGGEPLLWALQNIHLAQALGLQSEQPAQPLSPVPERESALNSLVAMHIPIAALVRAEALSTTLGVGIDDITRALINLENQGAVIRGNFADDNIEQWCERALLLRIYKASMLQRRTRSRAVPLAQFSAFSRLWQHLGEQQRSGADSLRDTLKQLQGHTATLEQWHNLLKLRIDDYQPEMLNKLCQNGQWVWVRLNPPNQLRQVQSATLLRRTPLVLLPRRDLPLWLSDSKSTLSSRAQQLLLQLRDHGASFSDDLMRQCGLLEEELLMGLRELAGCGLISADNLDALNGLMTSPKRKHLRRRRGVSLDLQAQNSGRWWSMPELPSEDNADSVLRHRIHALLRRYGVVFRSLIYPDGLPWRDVLNHLRTLEMREEIAGGRFVEGFSGEQFALPEAAQALKHCSANDAVMQIALPDGDPLLRIDNINSDRVLTYPALP